MPFFVALHALAVQAFAEPDPHQDFRAWLTEAAEAEGLRIIRWGALDRDEDGHPDLAVAWLCDPRARQGTEITPWQVGEASGQRWVIDRVYRKCGWEDRSPDLREFKSLELDYVTLTSRSRTSRIELTAFHGRGEVARSEQRSRNSHRRAPSSLIQDWRRRVQRRTWTDSHLVWRTNEAALGVVGSDSTEQPTLNRVLSGADSYDGPADASLSVVAVERDTGQVDVVIRVTDDVRTDNDRIELFWCRQVDDCIVDPDKARHVSIMWAKGGVPVVSSDPADGSGHPLPAVSKGDPTLEPTNRVFCLGIRKRPPRVVTATFSQEDLGLLDTEHWSTPFSVLFVDFDAPRDPPTRIATSDLLLAEPLSFGALVRHPDLRAFAPLTAAMMEDFQLHDIRILEPGQPLRPPE